MIILNLFDGISCGQLALKKLNIPVEKYYASEINKYAVQVTNKNFPNTIHLGDVRGIGGDDLPKIDLLMAGSPCQGFSNAGNGLNFEDPRSKLFFEFLRLKEELKPKYWLLENNKMKKEWENVISDYVGVLPKKINSSLVSAQNRERLYWTNIVNDNILKDKHIMLKDLVGSYDGVWVYPRGTNKGGVKPYKGKSPTITCSSWQHNFMIVKNGEKKKFPLDIVEQLQNLPVGYTEGVSENQRYKLIGNCWTVDVICYLLEPLRKEFC